MSSSDQVERDNILIQKDCKFFIQFFDRYRSLQISGDLSKRGPNHGVCSQLYKCLATNLCIAHINSDMLIIYKWLLHFAILYEVDNFGASMIMQCDV